ncbi:MAG TPA: IPT/TIG domain-containing protein [Gaiellaceae bacterium]|nr:IPT/TIG domain-containing protein [Gaiellaceae bacterium]
MRTRFLYVSIVAACAALAMLLPGAAGAAGGPEASITGITPTTAMVGQKLTISGTDLTGAQAVTIGNVAASPIAVDPGGTWVAVDVPAGVQPGSAMVVVTVNGTQYSTGPITIESGSVAPEALPTTPPATPGAPTKVVLAPKIALFSPAAGKAGSRVTIYGHNFVGVTWVKLAGRNARFHVMSKTRLWITVPLRARTGKLAVHAAGGTGLSSRAFKVVPAKGSV